MASLYQKRRGPLTYNFYSISDWWDVYRAGNTFDGIPILKHLFLNILERYPKAQFFGFASADILFDESLIVTLEHVLKHYDKRHEILILGRRTNAPVGEQGFHDFNDIRSAAKDWKSHIFADGLAQDYFIVTRGAIPWDRIPDFLVGREGFNPWLTAYALNSGLPTLDVTNTVLALHQTGKQGNYECRRNKMASVNKEIIGPNFDYSLGKIDCARYFTSFVETNPFHHSNHSINISARKPNPSAKLFEKYGLASTA